MKHWQSAQELANDALGGKYNPSDLTKCNPDLTIDQGNQIIRLTEFTLFTNVRNQGRGIRYLVLQPQYLMNEDVRKKRLDYRNEIVERWNNQLHLGDSIDDASIDSDKLRSNLRSVRWSSSTKPVEENIVAPLLNPHVSNEEFREKYKKAQPKIIDGAVRGALSGIAAALGGPIDIPGYSGGPFQLNDLAAALTNLAFPSPFQTINGPHVLVALCTTFEQTWSPRGYTRGELIGSLSLAPGERLTLEIHSWDKSTTRSETELALESEMRSTEKHTQRDALTVMQEYASKNSTKVEAKGTIPIPQLPLGVGASASTEAEERIKTTSERIRDDAVEASSVLKINRKIKVETSREVGRENKQTRVIENTNRCHAINCYYFEVISNYLVTTKPSSVEACLLIKYTPIKFTLDSILCHEGTLRQSLLDKTFLNGFQAAHDLKIAHEEEIIENRRRQERTEWSGAQATPYARAVSDAYKTLKAANTAMEAEIDRADGNPIKVAERLSPTQIDMIWAWYGLPVMAHKTLSNFVKELDNGGNAATALLTLLNLLSPGIPARSYNDALKDLRTKFNRLPSLVEDLAWDEIWNPRKDLLDCDDAGLRDSIQAVSSVVRALSPQESLEDFSIESARDIAVATVEFQRLQCHIENNWMHYNHAIWAGETFEQRFERFASFGPAAALIENRIIGFHGQYAAFPLRDLSVIKTVSLQDVKAAVEKAIAADASQPVLISVPSSGQVLESTVGECSACEDYIESSREIDLRHRVADARKEEAESYRRESLIKSGDLSNPESSDQQMPIHLRIDLEKHNDDSGPGVE